MAEPNVLTLAYISAHPADAARVLERQPTASAAAVLSQLPARAAAGVLAAMAPPSAARVISAVGDQVALGLLTAAGSRRAVAVLRHVAEPRRTRLVEGLPTVTAVSARLLLGYPEDTVGAWADPQAVALAPGLSVAEALDRVRAETEDEVTEVFVVDAEQRLRGVVDLATLLRTPEWRTLDALMRPPAARLPALMPLAGASSLPAWKGATQLPVVARGDRLVGVLRRAVLTEAVAARSGAGPDRGEDTLAGLAARGYWGAVSGLVRAGVGLLPAARPILPEEP